MDPVLELDWAAHWRRLVEARWPAAHGEAFWDRRAHRYALSMRGQADPFLQFLEPWLGPTRTLIDVGAGTGRHVAQLVRRLDWVTAVEPSPAMRELIPPADNLTVIGSTWEDADPAPADLVICVHVLYAVADVVPFIEKLERAGRERVFIVLRDEPHRHPATLLAAAAGVEGREPRLRDAFLLLRQMGIAPDLAMFTYPVFHRFESLEAAVDDCRERLGSSWDEARGRAWLKANLRRDRDGTWVHDGGTMTSGVLHWQPRR
ncbi:MAG TPA: methyltransferase domain-containing protein [Candidatus Dormibacteraeota bacterium]|nr:methyltransferase domain-containing protein [Candidatus Dormibacteraeota bacterium]